MHRGTGGTFGTGGKNGGPSGETPTTLLGSPRPAIRLPSIRAFGKMQGALARRILSKRAEKRTFSRMRRNAAKLWHGDSGTLRPRVGQEDRTGIPGQVPCVVDALRAGAERLKETRRRVGGHVPLVVIPARVAIQRPGLTGDGDQRVPATPCEDAGRGRLCQGLANASTLAQLGAPLARSSALQ